MHDNHMHDLRMLCRHCSCVPVVRPHRVRLAGCFKINLLPIEIIYNI